MPDTISKVKNTFKHDTEHCILVGAINRLSFEDFLLYTGELGIVYASMELKAHGDLLFSGYSGIRCTIEGSALADKPILGCRFGYEWAGILSVRASAGCYTNFNNQYSFTLNPEVGLLFGVLTFGVHLPVLGNEVTQTSFRLSLQLPLYQIK